MREQIEYRLGRLRISTPVRTYRGWGYQEDGEPKEWFGLNIGRFPLRKRYALYVDAFGVALPLAYFRGEVEANLAMALIEVLITKKSDSAVTVQTDI